MWGAFFIFDGKGGIKGFTGNYSEYREYTQINQTIPSGKQTVTHRDTINRVSMGKTKRKLTYKENQEFSNLETEIDNLEAEKNKLEVLFSKTDTNPVEMEKNNRKYKKITKNIETKLTRWEDLAELSE